MDKSAMSDASMKEVNRIEANELRGNNAGSGMCPVCGQNPVAEPHPCPYAQELNDDDTECDCCEECEKNCADEV